MLFNLRVRMFKGKIGLLFLVLGLLVTIMIQSVTEAAAAPLDGITIIKYSNDPAARQTLAEGSHLILFVSARGSYAAVVAHRPAHYSGCTSLAVPGSYTGTSIAFGMDAPFSFRKQRLQTYCPPFTVSLEDENMVRVVAGDRVDSPMEIVARIPFSGIDFSAPHFVRHNFKGVSLGPVTNSDDLSPLGARGYGTRSRQFQQIVGKQGNYNLAVTGKAAAAEITGWPVDVLYSMQFSEQFPIESTFPAFYDSVLEKYGEPSSRYKETGYMFWFYDLAGQKIVPETPMSNACRSTLEFRMHYDKLHRMQKMANPGNQNLDFWGCGLVMELLGNRSGGGVTGYTTRAFSGYVMAVNYFYQQIEETEELKKKIEALQERKPQF